MQVISMPVSGEQNKPVTTKSAEKIAYENNKLHKRLCRLVGTGNR